MKRIFCAFAILGALLVSSCSDDDKAPDLTVVNGNYSGKMAVVGVAPASVGATGTAFEATVADNTLKITKFPIRDIVVLIVGEAQADDIVGLVGDVKYDVAYTAAFSEGNDMVNLTLQPKALKINIPEMAVEVKIAVAKNAVYTLANGGMTYSLVAQSVTVNGIAFPNAAFPLTLAFNMTKK